MANQTVTINRNKLVYDIDTISWKTARTRLTETRSIAEAQTDSGSDNMFVLERRILTALQKVKQECRWCVASTTGTTGGSDAMTGVSSTGITTTTYTITFRDAISNKINWDDVALRVHNYMLYSVLADWFSYVMPSEVQNYATQAANEMSDLIGLFLRDAPAFPAS